MTIRYRTSHAGVEFGAIRTLSEAEEARLIADRIAEPYDGTDVQSSDVTATIRVGPNRELLGIVFQNNDGSESVVPLGGAGVAIPKATLAAALAGTADVGYMTPAKTAAAIAELAPENEGGGASTFAQLGGDPVSNPQLADLVDNILAAVAAKATPADITAAIAAITGAAPETLNAFNEFATAIANDPNFASTMTTALAGKQPLAANLTSFAAVAGAADRVPYFTGAGTLGIATFTSAMRTLAAAADQAAQRTALGLGSAALAATGDFAAPADVTTQINAAVANRSVVGLVAVRALATDRSVVAADFGAVVENKSATPRTLTIPTASALVALGVTWQDGRSFVLATRGLAPANYLADSGVTVENDDELVATKAAPLIFRMTETPNVWQVT